MSRWAFLRGGEVCISVVGIGPIPVMPVLHTSCRCHSCCAAYILQYCVYGTVLWLWPLYTRIYIYILYILACCTNRRPSEGLPGFPGPEHLPGSLWIYHINIHIYVYIMYIYLVYMFIYIYIYIIMDLSCAHDKQINRVYH